MSDKSILLKSLNLTFVLLCSLWIIRQQQFLLSLKAEVLPIVKTSSAPLPGLCTILSSQEIKMLRRTLAHLFSCCLFKWDMELNVLIINLLISSNNENISSDSINCLCLRQTNRREHEPESWSSPQCQDLLSPALLDGLVWAPYDDFVNNRRNEPYVRESHSLPLLVPLFSTVSPSLCYS